MEQLVTQRLVPPTPQRWSPDSYEGSQLPVSTAPTDVLTVSPRESATEDRDVVDGSQPEDASDASIDKSKIAQAALRCSPKNQQAFDMESVKALLRNFLDNVKEGETDRSSYFDGLLKQWLDISRTDRACNLLIYVLGDRSGQYDNRMLNTQELESIDRTKLFVLDQQGLRREVCVHLAKMTSAMNTDPFNAPELNVAIRLHEMCDLKGEQLHIKPVAVKRENILQKGLFEERYHQQSAIKDSYPSLAERKNSVEIDTAKSFQDWVLVIMPETYRFKFLIVNAEAQALHDWIVSQSADLQPSEIALAEADPNVRWGLKLACKTQLSNVNEWLSSSLSPRDARECSSQCELLGAVVCASSKLRSPELFHYAILLNPGMLSLTAWEEIGSTIDLRHFLSYQNSLTEALRKIYSFQDRYMILRSINAGSGAQDETQDSMTKIRKWIQDQFKQALKEIQRVEDNDGAIAILVARNFAPEITLKEISSFAKKHSSNHPFALEFAFSLYDELVTDTMDAQAVTHTLAEILGCAVPALCAGGAENWATHKGLPISPSFGLNTPDQFTVQADSMARLIRCCLTVGAYEEEHALLRYMWLGASAADSPSLQHLFLPYLQNLLGVMHDYRIPLNTQSYQWQFQHVISLFIIRYIGQEPTPPFIDFTSPPLGCASPKNPYGCPTCLKLDAFLVDPHQQTADITGDIDAPEHVAAQIQGTDDLQMTVVSHSAESMTCTLRITKNIKSEDLDVDHESWKARVIKANDLIQAICGDDEWKILLGDKYDDCMGLQMVRTG